MIPLILPSLTAAAPAPLIQPARVFAARDEILAGPEFNVASDWTTRFVDWFVATAERTAAALPGTVRVAALVLLLAVLAGLAMWLIPSLQARLAATPSRRGGSIVGTPDEMGFATAHAAARAALAEGRLRDCVRAVWLATLSLLQNSGVSPAQVTRTDWEHVEHARRVRPDLGDTLATLATGFQRTHFGYADVDHGEAVRCLTLLAQVETALSTKATMSGG